MCYSVIVTSVMTPRDDPGKTGRPCLRVKCHKHLLLRGSLKITLHVLYFRPIKPKIFCPQCLSRQFQFLVNPHPTLIHQNHTLRKEHALRDITLYISFDLIHHQSKKISAQS
jgi:hypothetical protein